MTRPKLVLPRVGSFKCTSEKRFLSFEKKKTTPQNPADLSRVPELFLLSHILRTFVHFVSVFPVEQERPKPNPSFRIQGSGGCEGSDMEQRSHPFCTHTLGMCFRGKQQKMQIKKTPTRITKSIHPRQKRRSEGKWHREKNKVSNQFRHWASKC